MLEHKQCPAFLIEYDRRGQRVRKEFDDYYVGRRFYIAKWNAGRNPKVVNPAKREKEQS